MMIGEVKDVNYNYEECVAEIGSMTQALKAQKALTEQAIPSTVVKTNSSKGGGGCAYGLSLNCAQRENAQNIFERSRVKVRRWKNEK